MVGTGGWWSGGPGWGPLLPDLAHLEQLQELLVVRQQGLAAPGLPPEWFQPGAFPSLHTSVGGGGRRLAQPCVGTCGQGAGASCSAPTHR